MGTDLDESFLSCLIFIFQHCFWMFVTQTLIWPDSTGITQHIEKAFCKWVKITNYLYIKKMMYLLEFNCIIVFFGWGCWVPHHCRGRKNPYAQSARRASGDATKLERSRHDQRSRLSYVDCFVYCNAHCLVSTCALAVYEMQSTWLTALKDFDVNGYDFSVHGYWVPKTCDCDFSQQPQPWSSLISSSFVSFLWCIFPLNFIPVFLFQC